MLLEKNDNPDALSFSDLLDEYDYESPERGQILEGTIIQSTEYEIIIDVGLKRDAIVSRQDLDRMDDDIRRSLVPGEEVQAWVLQPYSSDDELIVSINKALELEDWRRAQNFMDNDEVTEVEIIDQNKGGLLARFGRLRGFIPNSHIASIRRTTSHSKLVNAKDNLIGDTLKVKVIEINRRKNRLVMSEREVLHELRQKRLRELEPGTIVTGRVVHMVDFGAFVDLDGIDGLIHISNLDHRHVNHPSEVLSAGDEVTVRVNKVDVERERIDLDRKAVLPDPWETFTEKYKAGDLLTGTVTNVVDYGIFVAVPGGAQGLVHVNNMSTFGLSHPRDMFKESDDVLVRIGDIDEARQRIALSIDDVTVEEQEEWMYKRREAQKQANSEDGVDEEVVAEVESTDEPVDDDTTE